MKKSNKLEKKYGRIDPNFIYLASPILFFVCIFNLYIKKKNFRLNIVVFIANFILLIYLLIKSYDQDYIEIYYGIIGVIAYISALGGVLIYFRFSNWTKVQKINFLIYFFICLIIGFGTCSTTGIFG